MTFLLLAPFLLSSGFGALGSGPKGIVSGLSRFKGGETISFAETGISTETSASPLSQRVAPDDLLDAPLLRDIDNLNGILLEILEKDNPEIYEVYKELRRYGLERAANPDKAMDELEKMIQCAERLSAGDIRDVMFTFSIALNLVNAAEVHHRLRRLRLEEIEGEVCNMGPFPLVTDSVHGTIQEILQEKEGTESDIMEKLCKQKIEIVLTAHPTEVSRRTLLRKFRQITENLALLDTPGLHPYTRSEVTLDLKRIVSSICGADVIRRKKPTPQDEAAGGIAIIESSLWEAVPAFLRKLDAQCRLSLNKRLPVDSVPISFASWMGGDRDGNPSVSPLVTKEVVLNQRLRVAKLYLNDLGSLYDELAIASKFSSELIDLSNSITRGVDKIELYRRVISYLRRRLVRTVKLCENELDKISTNDVDHVSTSGGMTIHKSLASWESEDPIRESADLLIPLQIIYRSLMETGFEDVADGLLLDIMRRVHCFGVNLVRLDIREESGRHSHTMDSITRSLGIGSYKEWDEESRVNFLQSELAGKRPFFRTRDLDKLGFDDITMKTLRTFQMVSTFDPETLGAYVISQAQTASDVLAVMVLQKQFGMVKDRLIRVVPLFETLNDLNNAPKVLDSLLSMPTYVGAVRGKQEVMVGYSDSAKDAGRLAASWALYQSQEKMSQVASKHNIELTFFHGKGGTVGRGGNPALYRAILSHPPNTIHGRFRVTEQGEMITQNFGNPGTAERTLDIYTAAVLREAFVQHVEPKNHWRQQMERISDVSCENYRNLVRVNPKFVPYFRKATPELELGTLNIGSRPAKRNPKGGIESLRAIPWTFAWTQTRIHLSAWLGVGAAFNALDQDLDVMKEMYIEWPWFRETVDLISMIISKTDFSISKNYDDQLVNDPEMYAFGNEIRDMLVKTREGVIQVTGSKDVSGPHIQLQRASSMIRNPYVDPVNVAQAEILKRLRNINENSNSESLEEKTLQDAFVISVKAIAQGMRNSG